MKNIGTNDASSTAGACTPAITTTMPDDGRQRVGRARSRPDRSRARRRSRCAFCLRPGSALGGLLGHEARGAYGSMRRPDQLVLGGGGTLGEAWLRSLLAGLEDETGWDLRECDAFVGTSAGSIVAAVLAAGRRPEAAKGVADEWERAARRGGRGAPAAAGGAPRRRRCCPRGS